MYLKAAYSWHINTHLNKQILELANYNNFYALFAGLSAALVGIKYLHDDLLKKIDDRHDQLKDIQDDIIQKYKEQVEYSISFLNQDIEVDIDKQNELIRLARARERIFIQSSNIFKNFDIDKEKNIVSSRIPRISVHVFLYCVTLVVCCGLEQENVLLNSFNLLGTLTLLSYLSIYVLIIMTNRMTPNNNKMRYCFLISIGTIVLGFAYYFITLNNDIITIGQLSFPVLFRASDLFVLFSSIALCFLAFVLMFWRCLYWYFFTYILTMYKLRNIEKEDFEDDDIPPGL